MGVKGLCVPEIIVPDFINHVADEFSCEMFGSVVGCIIFD